MERKRIPFLKLPGPNGEQSDYPVTTGGELYHPSSRSLYTAVEELIIELSESCGLEIKLDKAAYLWLVEEYGVENNENIYLEDQICFFNYALGKIIGGVKTIPKESRHFKIKFETVKASGITYEEYLGWKVDVSRARGLSLDDWVGIELVMGLS